MSVPFSLVHHANQYLITEGYDNRHGLRGTLGSVESRSGLAWILELHRIYNVPANLHISGTLLEAIAWHQPAFLSTVRELHEEGLVEIVGSCYGQNIMRFFSYEHNLEQLNEELRLYKIHFGLDPAEVKAFWPPERVWDTERMAAVLNDEKLLNRGYKYLLLDDRLLLPVDGFHSPRRKYDREPRWDPQLFQAHRIEHGHGLIALPIATNLRQNIPPSGEREWGQVRDQLRWLSTLNPGSFAGDLIAIYADDMEKPAGVGWDARGPSQFEALVRWVSENSWIQPVKISDWCSTTRVAGSKSIDVGTFLELANHFSAGEGYEKWYFDPRWNPYRTYFSWSEDRVKHLASLDADPTLIGLAEKHLLASSWETAWHTPSTGAHGDPNYGGGPSPWVRAVASHSRHAAVVAEAAYWMKHQDGQAHAYLYDIDGDADEELVLKSDKLFAVFTPRWGGRLVYLFSVEGEQGKMSIGNPCDDWNLMEELNKYMQCPPNHPGALTDLGFENDAHAARILIANGETVEAELRNKQPQSGACGLVKKVSLALGSNALHVEYALPETLSGITIEFALSPDYLSLLRYGCGPLQEYHRDGARGCMTQSNGLPDRAIESTAVWVKPQNSGPFSWSKPYTEEFGHKCSIRLDTSAPRFSLSIGVDRT